MPRLLYRNTLIDRLGPKEAARLCGRMERVHLGVGERLCGLSQPPSHVYFPLSGAIVLDYAIGKGSTTAVSVVGREGVVGHTLFMSSDAGPLGALVVAPGEAFRLRADLVASERDDGGVPAGVLRYIQALTTQMAQTAVCNRHHLLPQQLARWLLLVFDRIDGGEALRITHDRLAQLLGVRREGITGAVGALHDAGGILAGRGRVSLADRDALLATACECHRMITAEYTRLLGPPLRFD